MLRTLFLVVGLTVLGGNARAHGGGLDKHGCHKGGGGYHCHRGTRGGAAAAQKEEKPRTRTCKAYSINVLELSPTHSSLLGQQPNLRVRLTAPSDGGAFDAEGPYGPLKKGDEYLAHFGSQWGVAVNIGDVVKYEVEDDGLFSDVLISSGEFKTPKRLRRSSPTMAFYTGELKTVDDKKFGKLVFRAICLDKKYVKGEPLPVKWNPKRVWQ